MTEQLINIGVVFGRCWEEVVAVLDGEIFGVLFFDLKFFGQIEFIADNNDRYRVIDIIDYFLMKFLKCVKRGFWCIVKDKHDTFCLFVENGREGSEALLTSCVPNGQFYLLVLNWLHFGVLLESNGRLLGLLKGLIYIPFDNGGFAYRGLSNNGDLLAGLESRGGFVCVHIFINFNFS